jgi:LuxR family transcriptional regulator, maltose regulon positive regulatory protein
LADGQPTRAAESLLAARERVGRRGLRIEELALSTSLALAQLALGDADAALRSFTEACRLAVDLGALRSMADQPVPLQPLLQRWQARRQALEADLDPFVERLVAASAGAAARRSASSLIETLSPRELDILRLVADGQSNKEIARGLRIAPETVKTHVSKIFGKLGASNRAQAAAMSANA